MFALIIALMGNASAETPEQSGQANVPAEARYAIGQATAASAKVIALEKRVAKLETRVRTLQAAGRKSDDPELRVAEAAVVQADDELAAAVKADALRAETAAGKAESSAAAAEASAVRAEAAAKLLENFEVPLPVEGGNSLDTIDRDGEQANPGFYGVVGIGNAWLGRQESYNDNGAGIYTLETEELMSNMLGGSIEMGVGGLGSEARIAISVRGEGMYNLGGGFAGFGEVVVGGWVEQTHVLRLEGFAGVSWEMIPTNTAAGDYSDRRWDLGMAIEFMPAEHFGIWFGGRFLPDNSVDFAGSNAGEAEIALRAHF